jgi:hypothetical protein
MSGDGAIKSDHPPGGQADTGVTAMLKPLHRMITTEVAASDGARDILKRKEIGDFWVSSQSQWRDRFWQFDNETAGVRAVVSRLHWDVALPDCSCLTDPQWAAQLDAFKRFTWSFVHEREQVLRETAQARQRQRIIQWYWLSRSLDDPTQFPLIQRTG